MSEYFETRYTFDSGRAKVWKAIAEYLQQYVKEESDSVLDLGAGYCDFINNIKAREKFAIDMNQSASQFCKADVKFHCTPVSGLGALEENSIDVVFASNLLEHLDDLELDVAINGVKRVLKPEGMVILIQPNYRYAYKEYFDDYTHKKAFSHISLSDFLQVNGFEAIKIVPRFLPFSLKSRLPKSYILTKIYLHSLYKPMAKQMLLIFKKA